MDAHKLAKLAMQLHNRIGAHAYMVGVKTTDKTPTLVVYVLKGKRVPAKAIPASYQGVPVEVAKLERVRPAC